VREAAVNSNVNTKNINYQHHNIGN